MFAASSPNAVRRTVPLILAVLVTGALAACGGGGGGESDASRKAALDALATPSGPMTTVPRLLGLRQRHALPLVRHAGLTIKPVFQGSIGNPSVESGCVQVVAQSPPGGTRRQRGSQIGVIFSVCHHAIGPAKARAARHGFGPSAQ